MSDSALEQIGLPPIDKVDTIDDPVFKQNRAMYDRAQRIFSDSTQPQVVRDDAKRQMIFYSMENIRKFDPLYVPNKIAKKALETGDKELLLEASNPDEDTQTPEHISTMLAHIESGETVDENEDVGAR